MHIKTELIPVFAVFVQPELGFEGNTAAVVERGNLMDDGEMQLLAKRLGEPATTFLSPLPEKANAFSVRWFAPDQEIDLCGHGAAAAGAYLGQKYPNDAAFHLNYREGNMDVLFRSPNKITLILDPIPVIKEIEVPEAIRHGLGIEVLAMFITGNKHIVLAKSEEDVKNLQPDFEKLRESEIFGYAVTAPGQGVDFVSRTFVPHVGQLEDPATGSSHAMLAHFWQERLGKTIMRAHQLSKRGGEFQIEISSGKVMLSGLTRQLR